jgi:hypothetical protein
MPLWFQITQSLLTLLLAGSVGYLAFRHWRTSHERAILDLFEKRWETYIALQAVISDVLQTGTSPANVSFSFLSAINKAEFLFGAEVNVYLRQVYKLLIDLDFANTRIEDNGPGQGQAGHVQKRYDILMALSKFYVTINPLVKPYMNMTQRLSRW